MAGEQFEKTTLKFGAQQIEVEVINQAANGRASATRGRHCHVYTPTQRFVPAPKSGGSESSKVRDYRQRHLLLRWDRRESGEKDRQQSGSMDADVPPPGDDG